MIGLIFHPAFRLLSGFQGILFYSPPQCCRHSSSGIFVGIKSQIVFMWNEARPVSRDPVSNCSSQTLKSLNLSKVQGHAGQYHGAALSACWVLVLVLLWAVISRSGFAKAAPHLNLPLLKVSSSRPQPLQGCPTSQCKDSYKEMVWEQPLYFWQNLISFFKSDTLPDCSISLFRIGCPNSYSAASFLQFRSRFWCTT